MLNFLLGIVRRLRILILVKCFEISELKTAQRAKFYLVHPFLIAFTLSNSYGINCDHFNQFSFCNNNPAYFNN